MHYSGAGNPMIPFIQLIPNTYRPKKSCMQLVDLRTMGSEDVISSSTLLQT